MVTLQTLSNYTSKMSASNQQFSLRWNNYLHHITYAFDSLRSHEDLVDVTLCCEGRKIRAHKILLSACSTYFKDVFKENPCQHPVIVFKNVKYEDLLAIIQFMYQGEVNVQQDSLPSFLNTAEMLSVQGLTDSEAAAHQNKDSEHPSKSQKIILPTVESKKTTTYSITTEQIDSPASGGSKIQSITVTPSDEHSTSLKRKQSIVEDEDENENISYIEGEELERSDMEMTDESTTHYLKMEIPEYIDVVENPNSDEVVPIDESIKSDRDDDKDEDEEYKVIETTDSDLEGGLYQNRSETTTLIATEIGRILTEEITDDLSSSKQSSNNVQEYRIQSVQRNSDLKCTYCGRSITSLAALKRHIESKHTKMNSSFACSICQKIFKTKWSLSTHFSRFHRKTYSTKGSSGTNTIIKLEKD